MILVSSLLSGFPGTARMTVRRPYVYAEPMARLGAEDNSVHDAATVTGLLDQLTSTGAPGPLEPSSRPTALDTDERLRRTPAPAPPTWVERMLVLVTVFVIIHELPMDWFRTRDDFLTEQGNPRLVVLQLLLMGLGIARVAGWFNWIIRAVQIDVTLMALAGLALTSTLWSADPPQTMKEAVILFTVTAYGTYLVLRFTLAEILELLARVFAVSGILNLGFILALPQYGISAEGLWDGVFFQKNSLGFASLLAIPILIVVGRSGPAWRHLYYLCVPVWFTLLIGSQSKTMLVATLGSCAFLLVYRTFRSRRTLRGAFLLALIALSTLTVAVATANIELLADWLDKDITLTGRVPLWQGLMPIIAEKPYLGYGYKAAFGGYFSPVHEVWVSEGWEPTHAHNGILQTWLDLGLVGVVVLVFGYIRATTRALTMVSNSKGAVMLWPLVYLSSALLISITESGVMNSREGWLLYVIAVVSAGLHARRRQGAPIPPIMPGRIDSSRDLRLRQPADR